AFAGSAVCLWCSVDLRSCSYACGILDVCRLIFRDHRRCAVARCMSPVWIWGGSPESGRAVHRAEDLVGGSCATLRVTGFIHAGTLLSQPGKAPAQALQPTAQTASFF